MKKELVCDLHVISYETLTSIFSLELSEGRVAVLCTAMDDILDIHSGVWCSWGSSERFEGANGSM